MIKLTQNYFDEYFNASTGIRDDTYDFAQNQIPATEWTKRLKYHKPSFEAAKKLIKESGVKGARRRLKSCISKMWGHNNW